MNVTVSKTNEQALEATIEKALTGTSREEHTTATPNTVADELVPCFDTMWRMVVGPAEQRYSERAA